MNRDALVGFLEQLGLWPLKMSGTHAFKIACLYQETKHDDGIDRHPSATISFDRGPSWFKCYSCDTKRPIARAIQETASLGGNFWWSNIATAMQMEEDRQQALEPVKRVGVVKQPELFNYRDALAAIRQNGGYDYTPEVIDHFASKGITPQTARQWGFVFVRQGYFDQYTAKDENGEPIPTAEDTIVLPTLYNHPKTGELWVVGAQGRPLHARTRKYYTFYSYQSHYHMFGDHRFSEIAGRPLFIVEGQYDVSHIWQEGHCAGGMFGLFMNKRRINIVKRAQPSRILLFTDPDERGQKAMDRIIEDMAYENMRPTVIQHDTDPKHCPAKLLDEFAAAP